MSHDRRLAVTSAPDSLVQSTALGKGTPNTSLRTRNTLLMRTLLSVWNMPSTRDLANIDVTVGAVQSVHKSYIQYRQSTYNISV